MVLLHNVGHQHTLSSTVQPSWGLPCAKDPSKMIHKNLRYWESSHGHWSNLVLKYNYGIVHSTPTQIGGHRLFEVLWLCVVTSSPLQIRCLFIFSIRCTLLKFRLRLCRNVAEGRRREVTRLVQKYQRNLAYMHSTVAIHVQYYCTSLKFTCTSNSK